MCNARAPQDEQHLDARLGEEIPLGYTASHRKQLHYQSWQSRQGRSRPPEESAPRS